VALLATDEGGPMRSHPEGPEAALGELRARRKEYWSTFQKYFSSRKSMIVIEEASAEHGRINWIDFRRARDGEGSTLHLHINPAGKFDAGVFGYNFVHCADKHGMRVVGTLKSEPDMNVLACTTSRYRAAPLLAAHPSFRSIVRHGCDGCQTSSSCAMDGNYPAANVPVHRCA